MIMITRPPKIVLLGMISRMPVGGAIWQVVHYLVGLKRLGYEPYYVEAHARTPSMLMEQPSDDGSARAAAFISVVMERWGMSGRWAYQALHDDGRCYGMSETALQELYGSAALIINLHGGTMPRPEHIATGRLVYLETDPVQAQIEVHDGVQATIDFLNAHCALFTFAENYGKPDCLLPVSDRFHFRPTRQPVVCDLWDSSPTPERDVLTTIGSWQQNWRQVVYRGETFHWSKHLEFAKYLDLPARTPQRFELALGRCDQPTQQMLEEKGWSVRPALDFSKDMDAYQKYITASRGEFTVAKDQNVRLRSGWFSDRSATYLAAGRPVITQETGFSGVLPSGEGLFGYSNFAEILAAVEAINGNYDHHCRAAAQLAREYFSYDVVLTRLLGEVGL